MKLAGFFFWFLNMLVGHSLLTSFPGFEPQLDVSVRFQLPESNVHRGVQRGNARGSPGRPAVLEGAEDGLG